jgi:ABC-type transport system involved in multi-copper enzyme maturation permease subunit
MSAVFVVAMREIRERRFLLATALTLGLFPFVFMLLPGLSPEKAAEIRDTLALLISVSFPVAVAFAVGGSVVSRELAEGRLAFYFARPISAVSLWAGKFLGAIGLVVASTALTAGPVAAINGGLGLVGENRLPYPLHVLAPGLFLFMGIAHVVATSYRSRSRLVILDLVLAVGSVAAFVALLHGMMYAGAGPVFALSLPRMLALAALAIVLGTGIQIAVGRSDRQRSHRAMSFGVWTLVGVFLLGCFLWSRSVLDVRPTRLGGVGFGVQAAPRGGSSVVFMCESTREYNPVFILDGASGAYTRFSSERMSVPAFARDGRAFWVARRPAGLEYGLPTLAIARFTEQAPRIDEVSLGNDWREASALAVDDDDDDEGVRVVLGSKTEVGLVDGTSGATLGHAPGGALAASFRPDGRIRLLQLLVQGRQGALVMSEWDPRRGAREERWRQEGEGIVVLVTLSAEKAFVFRPATHGASVIDLETGASSPLPASEGKTRSSQPGPAGLFLSDKRLGACMANALYLFGAGATQVVALGDEASCWGLAETKAGEVAVGRWNGGRGIRHTLFVDAGRGTVLRDEKDLLPAGGIGLAGGGASPEAGSFASRLFLDREGALLELRPDGTRRVVVAPPE